MIVKVLILNPNTTDAMTARIEATAKAFFPFGTQILAKSGRFGPRYISSRAAFAVASHAALDAYAASTFCENVVLLACFGDPGLDAIREMSPAPVVGLVEASAREASSDGKRFSIVTGGVLWEPMLRESLMTRGLADNLASIRTVAPDGGTIARDPDGALAMLMDACDACVHEDGAESVILGGVGLIGLAERIAEKRNYPVICSVMAGLRAATASVSLVYEKQPRHHVESIGLTPELTTLLS